MRRRTGARRAMIAFAAAVMAFTATPANAEDTFRFEGSGWGHAVGMTQFGARGQAMDGRSYGQIISYYYQGAKVGSIPSGLEDEILVGVRQNAALVKLRPRGGDATIAFAGKTYTAPRDYEHAFLMHQGTCYLKRETGKGNGDFAVTLATAPTCGPHGQPTKVTWDSSSTRLDIRDHNYDLGRGHAVLRDGAGGTFHLTVALKMDEYLYGLAEMPYAWEMEALKAQAVAGRSYAVHRLLGYVGKTPNPDCGCHVYDSIRDQVYAGWQREHGATTKGYWPRWRDAVNATSGQVVRADGKPGTRSGVVQAFYSSSSGGRTENSEDYWSAELPYLRSVDDPWSVRPDVKNSKAHWTASVGERTLRSKLGLDGVRSIQILERHESGSVKIIAFHGRRNGRDVTVTKDGHWLRNSSGLGLNSRFVRQVFLPPFVDDDGSPHEADIVFIADRGVTKGCNPPANDQYCPTADVTREQMAAFLVRALGLTRTSGKKFADVPADSTFATDIDKLATAGITKGCNPPRNDRFCPGLKVTREQMAAFMSRGWDLAATSGKRFSDVRSDSPFVADIDRLATAGLTRGCNPPDNTRFCPGHPVTREQMASFLARALRDL